MAEFAPQTKNPIARFILTRPALTVALIASVISTIGLLVLFLSREAIGNDFGVYWRAANEPVTAAYLPRLHNPFPYPPTMLLWIQPLALVSKWPAFVAWSGLSLVVFLAACRRYLDGRTILLALVSPAMFHCIATGQVSAALAGLLIYALSTPHRARAGIALAVIASIKPQLVLAAPLYLLVTRDWRAIANLVPIAVFNRPGSALRALSSPAARALWRFRHDPSDARSLAGTPSPAWVFLPSPHVPLSSTELRSLAKSGVSAS